MIIWINGSFGAGKTQTACELLRRTRRTVIIDPEDFGSFIRRKLPREAHKSDYRQHEVWKTANRMLIAEAAACGYDVIVPMTISDRTTFADTVEMLARDYDMVHIVLSAPPEVLRKRLRGRLEFSGWAYEHMEWTLAFFRELETENIAWDYRLDTTALDVSETAAAIAAICGIEISPAGNPLFSVLRRAAVTLKHIRP